MKPTQIWTRRIAAGVALTASLAGCQDAQQLNAPHELAATQASAKLVRPTMAASRRASLSAGAAGLSWESDIGEPFFNCDDCSYGIMLDFPFTFYGESEQWWYITSNGFMSTHNRSSMEDTSFPHRRGDAIAPLAMDWWPDGEGPVHVNTLGSAPHRRFVVTWRNVPPYAFGGGRGGRSTFQLQLFEGSNQIQFGYNGLTELTGAAHAGLGNYEGDRYTNAAIGAAAVFALDGTNLCFTPTADGYTQASGPCAQEQEPQAPVADLVITTAPDQRTEGNAIAFDGSASANPGGGTLTYHWAFGDGSTGSGANPTHVYADNGIYTVTLTVTNASGLSNMQTAAIGIGNVAPAVSASLSAQRIVSGQTVQLAGSFNDPGVQDGPWNWTINWGTGTPATGAAASVDATINGSQRFCSARGYNVVLSVRDKDEATGSASATLTVDRKRVDIVAPASLPANGNGMVTVTVLGTADFDATTINLHSVLLSDGSGAGAPIATRGNGSYHATVDDVNGDGRMDLTLKFNRDRIGLRAASTQLVLLGAMDDRCTEIRGASAVRVK